jgi:uncharacterized protein
MRPAYKPPPRDLPRFAVRSSWPFFILTIGWAWFFWLIMLSLGLDLTSPAGITLFALGGASPLVAAVGLTHRMESAEVRRDFWRRVFVVRRIPAVWLLVAVFWGPVLNLLGIATGILLGAGAPAPRLGASLLADPVQLIPTALFFLILGPLPEELGWRGYVLDRLQRRYSALAASLMLGAVWAVWHAPMFLMEGSIMAALFPIGTARFWLGWVVPIVAVSVVYTWVHNHTCRSTLAAVLLHFTGNVSSELWMLQPEMLYARTAWTVVLVAAIVAYFGPRTLRRSSFDPGAPSEPLVVFPAGASREEATPRTAGQAE